MIGIVSYGGYIPRLRMDRMSIYQQVGWFAPAVAMVAQGERAMCNWDEDSVTMAVAAARDCLAGKDKARVEALYLASTTLPFADRLNAGIVATALNLRDEILAADVSSSLKAGTSALIAALDGARSGRWSLVTAADRRETRSGSFYEMWFGDGAAALLVGDDEVIAEFEGAHSLTRDFVGHYRATGQQFDYAWEERWIRDEGYSQIIPEAIKGLLEKLGLSIDDVDRVIYPCFFAREHAGIGRAIGARPEMIAGNLHQVCGETGAAHPLVMLAHALEDAEPGQRLLVAGFGQGCDALCFRVTEGIRSLPARKGVQGSLADKQTVDQYLKFLKFRGLVETEAGIRAEGTYQTSLTTLWRSRKMILGLVGGRCTACGTPQFPKADICVNPECGASHTQEEYEFADRPAVIKSFTGDMLAVSPNPPAIYGMVQFEDGGRLMADFTDCELADVKVGMPARMVFRRHHVDRERGIIGYFWKAVPLVREYEAREQERAVGAAETRDAEQPQATGVSAAASFFQALPGCFQPGAAAGADAVFQFSLSGKGGGEWFAGVKDGACAVEQGQHPRPTTTLKMTAGDFLLFAAGQLPAMQAFTSGRLKIEGDLLTSQLVEKLFKLH